MLSMDFFMYGAAPNYSTATDVPNEDLYIYYKD